MRRESANRDSSIFNFEAYACTKSRNLVANNTLISRFSINLNLLIPYNNVRSQLPVAQLIYLQAILGVGFQ